jgi:hypothetical protein
MEAIRAYEQELSSTCAEITLVTGRLRLAAATQEVEEMSAELDGLFAEAREGLEQMELERQTGLEAGPRERVGARLASYRAELARQEEQVGRCSVTIWRSAVQCGAGASVQDRGGREV